MHPDHWSLMEGKNYYGKPKQNFCQLPRPTHPGLGNTCQVF